MTASSTIRVIRKRVSAISKPGTRTGRQNPSAAIVMTRSVGCGASCRATHLLRASAQPMAAARLRATAPPTGPLECRTARRTAMRGAETLVVAPASLSRMSAGSVQVSVSGVVWVPWRSHAILPRLNRVLQTKQGCEVVRRHHTCQSQVRVVSRCSATALRIGSPASLAAASSRSASALVRRPSGLDASRPSRLASAHKRRWPPNSWT